MSVFLRVKGFPLDRFTGQKNLAAGISTFDAAHQHRSRLPTHLLAGDVEGGELHMAAFRADMATEHDGRKITGDGQATRARSRLDTHRIGELDKEGDSRTAAEKSVQYLVCRTSRRFDMQDKLETVAESTVKARPPIGSRFRRSRWADIGELRMPERPCLLDERPRAVRIIAADIGNRPAGVLAPADRHERIVAGYQSRQLRAVEFAAEHEAAIGDP